MIKKQIPTPISKSSKEDSNASKEAESFANEDLEEVARKNEHNRREQFKKHLSQAALVIFWIIASSFSVMALIWVYHLITPDNWHFLTLPQTDKIQTILFSATAIKLTQDYLKKHS